MPEPACLSAPYTRSEPVYPESAMAAERVICPESTKVVERATMSENIMF